MLLEPNNLPFVFRRNIIFNTVFEFFLNFFLSRTYLSIISGELCTIEKKKKLVKSIVKIIIIITPYLIQTNSTMIYKPTMK